MDDYQKERQLKELSQSEASIPLVYRNELSLKDKENIFKDIYSSIKLFYELIYEAKKEFKTKK